MANGRRKSWFQVLAGSSIMVEEGGEARSLKAGSFFLCAKENKSLSFYQRSGNVRVRELSPNEVSHYGLDDRDEIVVLLD